MDSSLLYAGSGDRSAQLVYSPPMRQLIGVFVLLGACCGIACGDDDNGYYGGGPCRDNYDCPPGTTCEHKNQGGYCEYSCRDNRDCGPGTSCVDAHGGTCHVLCQNNNDCPGGFDCKKKKSHGSGGDSFVCEP